MILRLLMLSVVFLCYGCSSSKRSDCPLDLVLDAKQADKIRYYEGCNAVIKGNVRSTYHSRSAYYLNFGQDYKKTFSVVIFLPDSLRMGIQAKDIDALKGKDIQVSGVIKTYRPDWSFTSKPEIILSNLQDIVVYEKKNEGAILPKNSSSSESFNLMLLASLKELKANSLALCAVIKNRKNYDQSNKNNKAEFNKTYNLIKDHGSVFFENAYGEDKNMMPIIEGLKNHVERDRLYMTEIPFYGKIRNAEDLLYLNDFYYWYSIPFYNKHLDKSIINELKVEKGIKDFYQPCNSYLYKIDKEWDEQWDFSKEKNPTLERYSSILGRLD